MSRPIRIPIFAVLCLTVGGFVVLQNFAQLVSSLGGPDAIQIPAESQSGGPFANVMRDNAVALKAAMHEPVYRIGTGLKAVLSLLMAGVLIGAGVGLIKNQFWALRLAKIWGIYAILSAIANTILPMVYIVPNLTASSSMPGVTEVAMYVVMVFLLIIMCIFPALLIFLLPSRNVAAYLQHQTAGQPQSAPYPAATAHREPPTSALPTARKPTSPAPPVSATDMTWRDDPWNDPNS
jgi:hypothetical protein